VAGLQAQAGQVLAVDAVVIAVARVVRALRGRLVGVVGAHRRGMRDGGGQGLGAGGGRGESGQQQRQRGGEG